MKAILCECIQVRNATSEYTYDQLPLMFAGVDCKMSWWNAVLKPKKSSFLKYLFTHKRHRSKDNIFKMYFTTRKFDQK